MTKLTGLYVSGHLELALSDDGKLFWRLAPGVKGDTKTAMSLQYPNAVPNVDVRLLWGAIDTYSEIPVSFKHNFFYDVFKAILYKAICYKHMTPRINDLDKAVLIAASFLRNG